MLKEIHEQPDAIAETIGERLYRGELQLDGLNLSEDQIRNLSRVVILACGTAYHAGLIGRYLFEEWARLPAESDIASEWRYRRPVIDENTLVVAVSQSGETIDTIAAMKEARDRGGHVLAVTNVMGSQATRDCDSVLYTRAGLEIGVAASKTFTSQVVLMYLLALKLGMVRGTIDATRAETLLREVRSLPDLAQETLDRGDLVEPIADRFWQNEFFLYLGRYIGLPIALEGALKLKEISYIPTDAYAAGEMKHGPIALLDDTTPVVVVATDNHVYDKVVSNIQEVRARGAHVIAVATEGNPHRRPRRARAVPAAHRAGATGGAGDPAAAAAGVRHRQTARAGHRQAAQPGEDRYGRVAGVAALAVSSAAPARTRTTTEHRSVPDNAAQRWRGLRLEQRVQGFAYALRDAERPTLIAVMTTWLAGERRVEPTARRPVGAGPLHAPARTPRRR